MKLLQRLLTSDVPMLADGALTALLARANTFDIQLAEHPYFKKLRDTMKPQMSIRDDGIAIVPIEGMLARKPDVFELFYGVEDTAQVLSMVESAMRNPDVRGVAYDFDSPGGFLTGGPEVADAIAATNKLKPTVAFVGGTCASLAYWMASQAGSIVASRSAVVGSIGVYATHVDYSKYLSDLGVKVEVIKNKEADYKALGIMGTALTDEQRSHLQERIQASFKEFKAGVKRGRPDVPDEAMQGQTFTGAEGKRVGLVDRVGDMGFALGLLKSEIRKRAT